jgi:hypothetical protein
VACRARAGFVFGLFDPEDGGDVPPKRRLTFNIPEDGTLHNSGCEDLKSYSINLLVFIMENQCVLCEVRTDFLKYFHIIDRATANMLAKC